MDTPFGQSKLETAIGAKNLSKSERFTNKKIIGLEMDPQKINDAMSFSVRR